MLIRNAEILGRPADLRCRAGRITEIAPAIQAEPGETEIDARGGALVPGLHDHHVHLLALAAGFASIPCGPPEVESHATFARVLADARPVSGWIRGTGYFESVAGPLDRKGLDALQPRHPLRIQHRSGSMWFLNSAAIRRLDLDAGPRLPGIERDRRGRATGRLFRMDDWLRKRLPIHATPDLRPVGRRLASFGVTRLTDATPSNGATELDLFRRAQAEGALPQRLRLMGDLSLPIGAPSAFLEVAEYKILLDEPSLPDLEELTRRIAVAHEHERTVALHAVTRTEIHFALAALEAAGPLPGDRLEHASVAPIEARNTIQRLGIRIVTQPHFISERGDAYLASVSSRDLPHLYLLRSWLEAGVRVHAGTDAPFGGADPWLAMRAATKRRTRSGGILGIGERVEAEAALALFSEAPSSAAMEGTAAGALRVGRIADLCLLDAPWKDVREDLAGDHVALTVCDGEIIWRRGP